MTVCSAPQEPSHRDRLPPPSADGKREPPAAGDGTRFRRSRPKALSMARRNAPNLRTREPCRVMGT